MFYRVTRYEYPAERYDEILAWAETKTDILRGIEGLQSVDTFVPGPGEGITIDRRRRLLKAACVSLGRALRPGQYLAQRIPTARMSIRKAPFSARQFLLSRSTILNTR